MKREAYRHPKIYDLAARLQVSRATAIGIVQLLLDYTADVAPQGNIGKWPNGTIARACEWDGDPDQFVTALTESKWLDACHKHRLVVHDLEDHAEQWWKLKLRKMGEWFVSATAELTAERSAVPSADRSADHSAVATAERSILPSPPLLSSTLPSSHTPPVGSGDCVTPDGDGESLKLTPDSPKPKATYTAAFEQWYAVYPRKIDKGAASAAFGRAVAKVAASRGISRQEASEWLCEAAADFAASPAGQQGSFTPYPSTWLSSGRYDDDRTEWQRSRDAAADRKGQQRVGPGQRFIG